MCLELKAMIYNKVRGPSTWTYSNTYIHFSCDSSVHRLDMLTAEEISEYVSDFPASALHVPGIKNAI
jgi:hypothetical protein